MKLIMLYGIKFLYNDGKRQRHNYTMFGTDYFERFVTLHYVCHIDTILFRFEKKAFLLRQRNILCYKGVFIDFTRTNAKVRNDYLFFIKYLSREGIEST